MTVLDVGCGTGALLQVLAETVPDVELVGLDLSGRMLDIARRRVSPPVTLVRGDVQHLPFVPRSFDRVVSVSALHFWPDPARALRELVRVLADDGELVITDWCDEYLVCRLCDRLLRIVDPAHQRIYTRAQCRDLLAASGVTVRRLERYKISWLWGLMTAVGVSAVKGEK